MAFFHGKDANLTYNATTYAFSYWSADIKSEFVNTTVFGAAWKSFIVGLKEAQITLRGPYNEGSLPFTPGDQQTLVLKLSSTTKVSATFNVENIKLTADANDSSNPVMLEVSGRMSGTVTTSIT